MSKNRGYSEPLEVQSAERMSSSQDNSSIIADSINWVELGMVSPVGNNGYCMSDWAFVTTSIVEGAYGVQ